jgi:hypothetical protein
LLKEVPSPLQETFPLFHYGHSQSRTNDVMVKDAQKIFVGGKNAAGENTVKGGNLF